MLAVFEWFRERLPNLVLVLCPACFLFSDEAKQDVRLAQLPGSPSNGFRVQVTTLPRTKVVWDLDPEGHEQPLE